MVSYPRHRVDELRTPIHLELDAFIVIVNMLYHDDDVLIDHN